MRGVSRRRWLRGAGGALLALPVLHSLEPAALAGNRAKQPRFLVYYLPNGRRPEWWVPTGGQGALVFPEQAASLQPFADRVLVVNGLDNVAARNGPGAAHAMGTGTVMTGTLIPDLSGIKNDISLDQLLVRELEPQSRFGSLQYSSGEPGVCDVGGSPCAYTQSISWAGPGTPLYPTIDPRSAFDRLFRSGTDGLTGSAADVRKASHGSVLDHVLEDATALEPTLSTDDRTTLEEYFDSLRDLEKSLLDEGPVCAEDPSAPGLGLSYPERTAVFHELIRLAFSCDQTRFISFMIEFGLSARSHDFLNAPGGHHNHSHSDFERLEIIERWQAQQLAAMLSLLRDTPGLEGGSLLDETIVLAMPSMGAGYNHDHAHVCPMLFGGDGVIQSTGRRLDVAEGTPLTFFHAALVRAYGLEGTYGTNGAIFGDDGLQALDGVG